MAKNNNSNPKSFTCPECGERAEAYTAVLADVSVYEIDGFGISQEQLTSVIACTRCEWGDTFQGILSGGAAAAA